MRYRLSRDSGASAPHSRQRGVALVIAMLVFAMASMLVVAMASDFQRFFQRSSNLLHAEQASAYLRGAEELAALVLLADYDEDKQQQQYREDLVEIWAQQPSAYPLDHGAVMTAQPLEDLQGRFNLNALLTPASNPGDQGGAGADAQGNAAFSPAQQQFIRLLQTLAGVDISEYEAKIVTRSIIDWLDADSNVLSEGAEDDFYDARTPPHRAANQPMASVSELRAVANVTPEIYNALAPLVTVWPRDASGHSLNIHTAKPQLLRTLNNQNDLSPLLMSDIEALVELQKEGAITSLAEFLEEPAFAGKNLAYMQSLLGEESAYFLLSATVTLADRNTHLYSVLHRAPNRQVTTLVRAGGSL